MYSNGNLKFKPFANVGVLLCDCGSIKTCSERELGVLVGADLSRKKQVFDQAVRVNKTLGDVNRNSRYITNNSLKRRRTRC